MNTTEKALWKKVRAMWPGHAVRVEASEGGVDPGTPDSNLSVDGHGGWVELKVWPEPITPIQVAWHVMAEMSGATTEVWVQVCEKPVMVWRGRAEAYERMVAQGRKPVGVPLATVIGQLVRVLR